MGENENSEILSRENLPSQVPQLKQTNVPSFGRGRSLTSYRPDAPAFYEMGWENVEANPTGSIPAQ